jgi:HEAT repeat protein
MSDALIPRLHTGPSPAREDAIVEAASIKTSAISSALVDALLKVLTDADPKLVVRALETLGQWALRAVTSDKQKVLTAVSRCTRSDHPRIRSEAVVTLVLIDDPANDQTVEMLLSLLEDHHPRVRQEAAAALGDVKSTKAIAPLCSHLEDEDAQTRFEASFALASLGDPHGLPLLLKETESNKKRFDALEGIRRLKDSSALQVLRPLSQRFFLGWPERLTVYATMYALGDIEAAQFLLKRAQSKNKAERRLAIGLIGTHKVVQAAPLLIQMALDRGGKFRSAAIHALGELQSEGALSVIQSIIDDDSNPKDVLEEARNSIAALKDKGPN